MEHLSRAGVEGILKHRVPSAIFLRFLLEELGSETLFCYLELRSFDKSAQHFDLKQRIQIAQRICRLFLLPSAPLEVNISAQAKKMAVDFIDNPWFAWFDSSLVQQELWPLLHEAFIRFTTNSPLWDNLVSLELLTDDLQRRKHAALKLNIFISQIPQHSWTAMSEQTKLIVALVKAFIRIRLGVDICPTQVEPLSSSASNVDETTRRPSTTTESTASSSSFSIEKQQRPRKKSFFSTNSRDALLTSKESAAVRDFWRFPSWTFPFCFSSSNRHHQHHHQIYS